MGKISRLYTLILQNNASKQFFVFDGLEDISTSHLYYQFDADLSACTNGEYTYAVVMNYRTDVEYELKTPLLSTILHTEDGDVKLADLQPSTGLLQIGAGEVVYENVYDKDEENTVFYYDN